MCVCVHTLPAQRSRGDRQKFGTAEIVDVAAAPPVYNLFTNTKAELKIEIYAQCVVHSNEKERRRTGIRLCICVCRRRANIWLE